MLSVPPRFYYTVTLIISIQTTVCLEYLIHNTNNNPQLALAIGHNFIKNT